MRPCRTFRSRSSWPRLSRKACLTNRAERRVGSGLEVSMVRRSGWVGLVVVVAIATLAASAEAVTITLYRLPTPDSRIGGMTLGRGGDVWFTEIWGNKIGRLTPEGSIQEFEIPTPSSDPPDLPKGSD